MTAFLIWLYGLSAWGAACNVPAWALRVWRWRTDGVGISYLTLRLFVLLSSVGVGAGSIVRGSTLIRDPSRVDLPLYIWTPFNLVWPGQGDFTMPGWSQATWMVCLALAELLALATAAFQARAHRRRPWSLMIYGVGAVAWTLAVGRL